MSSRADLHRALRHYGELAPRYDRRTRLINGIRREAIDALQLAPGDRVLDVGCGTGWCLPYIVDRVGRSGRVVGFDPSPEMLRIARRRTGGGAVELVCATAAELRLQGLFDAILFSYTHDILQSRAALENVLSYAAPGARVAATSTKLYARWLFPANWYLRWSHRGYITDFEAFERPWSLLEQYLASFQVRTGPLTQHYVATGRVL